ncbi:MAG: NINE protein [Oscillospiraceae bacterium]
MEDKMPGQEGRKFINLSKPISDESYKYNSPNAVNNDFNPANYQQEIYPQGNQQRVAYPKNSSGQEIYPGGNPTMYKENTIPKSSADIPTVQPSIVSPPVIQNNVNYNQPVQQANQKFCKYCGQKIHMEAVVCPHCGRQVEQLKGANQAVNGNVYINNAGQTQYMIPVSPYTRSTAVLLACLGFIGIGGIHRFYCGKYLSGLLYLFTAGLFGVGTLVDVVRIASGNFRDSSGLMIKN